jgi:uncharacterized damage-inducible protein DinB
MQLTRACTTILHQLLDVIQQLKEADFARPSAALSNATVGQHTRHTLEFFLCLQRGFERGVVNYDQRAHDKLIEEDKWVALTAIQGILDFVTAQPENQSLLLEVGYQRESEECVTLSTNYYRELTYNIEHAVHHMAIMKIGLREVAPYVVFSPDFGIAVSTIRHQQTVAAAR